MLILLLRRGSKNKGIPEHPVAKDGHARETRTLGLRTTDLRGFTRGGNDRERLAQRLILMQSLQPGLFGRQARERFLVKGPRHLPKGANVNVDRTSVCLEQTVDLVPFLGGRELQRQAARAA